MKVRVFKLIYILELVLEQTENNFSNLNNRQPVVGMGCNAVVYSTVTESKDD